MWFSAPRACFRRPPLSSLDQLLSDIPPLKDDEFTLLASQQRWAVAELPPELKQTVRRVTSEKKGSKLADKFQGLHDKRRRKYW